MLTIEFGNLYGMDSMRDLLQTINDLKELGMSDSEIQSILERSKENKQQNG